MEASSIYKLCWLCNIIAIAGVFALYPKLSTKAPRISLVGAVFLVVTVIGFFAKQIVMLGNNIFALPGFILSEIFTWSSFISFTAGYLLIGIAAFRTDHFPKLLGFALLTVAAITTIVITLYILRGLGGIPAWINLTIVSSHALVYLAMGYILKNKDKITKTKILAT